MFGLGLALPARPPKLLCVILIIDDLNLVGYVKEELRVLKTVVDLMLDGTELPTGLGTSGYSESIYGETVVVAGPVKFTSSPSSSLSFPSLLKLEIFSSIFMKPLSLGCFTICFIADLKSSMNIYSGCSILYFLISCG